MKIDPERKLPCDFIVGHIRYRKGVQLETVRAAAERWLRLASEAIAVKPGAKYDLQKMLDGITDENKHPEV